MSVINKMLRDLDQRQVPDDNGGAKPGATPLHSGVASVPGISTSTRAPRLKAGAAQASVAALLAVVCIGAGWWWLHRAPAAATPVVPAAPASVASVPAAVVATVPAAVPVAVASVPSAPVAVPAPVKKASGTAAVAVAAPVAASAATTAAAPVPPPKPAASPANAAPPTASAQTPPAVPDAAATGLRQQQAARDAQAQAQALWNAGARDNAVELLQLAVGTAERSAQATPGAPATQALASLARELARMQLAQGRPAASVDMLARLEPLLGGEPDIWALRANAAQRAGRHQESVNAYTTALQSRPGEQRWLLGAAVSSAALGQTSNAAALAEKAAAAGPLPKDVQAYLRQMGVPLKE